MEIIGTVASIIILISFLFDDLRIIRIINIIGCIVFIIYGTTIKSFSIELLNSGLFLIHIYHLLKKN